MNKRQTIGNDFIEQLDDSPFDLLVSPKEPLNGKEQAIAETTNTTGASTEKKKEASQKEVNVFKNEQNTSSNTKERMTVQIGKSTIECVKDCVYWNRTTVAQFVEEALVDALKKAERDNGAPFQKRRSELKPGRPTK